MKTVSSVFITISMIIYSLGLIFGIAEAILNDALWLIIVLLVSYAVMLITASSGLVSISNNKKRTSTGVMLLLFVTLMGGIFYLCWNGNAETINKPIQNVFQINDRVLLTITKKGSRIELAGTIISYDKNENKYKVRTDNNDVYKSSGSILRKIEENTKSSTANKLREIKSLYDQGVISDIEYNEKRQKYLRNL